MLAACGIAQVIVARRPRVAILSTGDELVQPGRRCAPPRSTTPTARSSPRLISENGGEAVFLGAIADDEAAARNRDAQGA